VHILLANKARRGFRGYPLASITYFGPDNRVATKVTVAISTAAMREPGPAASWNVDRGDVRNDGRVDESIAAFVRQHAARSVVIRAGVSGCPHDAGVEDWEGHVCPHCPYWAGRSRWAREPAGPQVGA